MGKIKETCGRCSVSTVVETIGDENGGGGGRPDPFDGERIEVAEETIRRVMFPAVWLGRVKTRLDETATRLVYRKPP